MNRLTTGGNEGSPFSRWGFLGDDFDQAVQGFFRPLRWVEEAPSENFVPPMKILERENEYVVHTDLPGVRKEDINVTLENGVLTITAERRAEQEQKASERELRKEVQYGRYVRSLRLGIQIDEKDVKAKYQDGVLELILPKAEQAKPRKISVNVG